MNEEIPQPPFIVLPNLEIAVPLRRIGDTPDTPETTEAPTDSFEAAMETSEELSCGVENPDECEACG